MPSNEFYLSQFKARSPIHPPKRVIIFDTSMRDGEQTPGVTYTNDEKIEIARKFLTRIFLGLPRQESQ